MSWDEQRPWTAPAKTLVLYRSSSQWRFAVHDEAGAIDGRLGDLPLDTSPEIAQNDLLNKVQENTGLTYSAACL